MSTINNLSKMIFQHHSRICTSQNSHNKVSFNSSSTYVVLIKRSTFKLSNFLPRNIQYLPFSQEVASGLVQITSKTS